MEIYGIAQAIPDRSNVRIMNTNVDILHCCWMIFEPVDLLNTKNLAFVILQCELFFIVTQLGETVSM